MVVLSLDLLTQSYRPVRRVEAGADAPFTGMLCSTPSGDAALLVDLPDLPVDWSGWRASRDGHMLAPYDIVRTADGHAALLPVFTMRLDEFVRRRTDRRRPLSTGESVTVVVSLLRGAAEVVDAHPDATGEWWLTDAGRPVLVTDAATSSARQVTIGLLDEVCAGQDAAAWREAREAVREPRLPFALLARVEDALFALAAAEPLAGIADDPPEPSFSFEPLSFDGEGETTRPWWEQLGRHVDADTADLVSRATTGVWRRLRRPSPPARRGRVALLAGAVGVVIVAGGMLWPSDGPAVETASAPTVSASADPLDDASPPAVAPADAGAPAPASDVEPASDSEASDAPDDLVTTTSALLEARTACAGDTGCLGDVLVDATTAYTAGPIDLAAADRAVTMVDEFGGVAVLRVDALDASTGPQLVVVQQDGDRWLLRDVYAAQQP